MKIESILKKLAMLAMLGAFVLGTGLVAGCEDSDDPADAIGDAANDAGDAIGDAADDAKDAMEDAGDEVKDATN